jgi:hypothetical protein
MNQQPEAGNGRIDNAAEPADGPQCLLHYSILLGVESRSLEDLSVFRAAAEVHRLSFLVRDLVKILIKSQHPDRACSYEDLAGRRFLH